MSQGFLLFAYNNEEIDYGLMAAWTARRIGLYLGKPVSLVTDSNTVAGLDVTLPNWRSFFDQVLLQDSNTNQQKRYLDAKKDLTFHNINRIYSYDLSPYDETIVIDTDIAIQSNQLNKLWNSNEDLIVCDKSQDIKHRPSPEFEYINKQSIKFFWATVFYFRKSQAARLFFNECKRVKENYSWYRQMYHFASGPVRNDYIWSTVIHTMGGTANTAWATTIPWPLMHATPKDIVMDMNESAVRMFATGNIVKVPGKDLHIMNKVSLLNFIKKELGVIQ